MPYAVTLASPLSTAADDNIDVDEEDDDDDGGSNDGDRGDAIVVPSKEQIVLYVGSSWRITVGVLSNRELLLLTLTRNCRK